MANEIISNEYPLQSDSYVAFDAISLRNLIIRRLNEQKLFTDQNYIGSNLASIIDIISFAYNTLIFYLNKTSSESMFTEAQIYENISRIVKLLDYKPVGFQTSTLVFSVSAPVKLYTDSSFNINVDIARGEAYTIPRYSYLMVGGVPFSFNEDITFSSSETGLVPLQDVSNRYLLFQGIYKETIPYEAQGDENEILTISNPTANIDHFNIDVYVYEKVTETWYQYKNVPSLYAENSFSRSFEKRLTSDRNYEILFGDGINGKKLQQGDIVISYYLESNGERGVIGPKELESSGKISYSSANFQNILDSINVQDFRYLTSAQFSLLNFTNLVGSTLPKTFEDADSIRKNAPSNYKSQYRLVTKEDYESFISTNFANFVSDIKVFSNWDYTTKYLKYFHDISVKPTAFRQILLNQVLYADSCNFNNIYLCCIPRISPGSTLKYLLPAQKEAIISNVLPFKTLTTEVVFLDPIYKAVSFGVKNNNTPTVTQKEFTKLQVIKSSRNFRSNTSILNDIVSVFQSFFDPTISKLGTRLQHSNLVSQILAIEGVEKIQTKRLDTSDIYNGLSLLVWNPVYQDLDTEIVVNDVEMQPFDFVYFDELNSLASKIEIISTPQIQ